MENRELKNLLDFFIMSGIDENTENVPINYYQKTIENKINIEKIDNSSSVFLSDISIDDTFSKINTMQELKEKLDSFECDIKKHCLNVVFGQGSEKPTVMVIGEYPNNDTDKSGIPFSGTNGELLNKMLASIGLSKETNTWLTYIFPYKTPGNRLPTNDEISLTLPFIKKQITLLNPDLIITLNTMPLNILKGTNYNISKVHGEFYQYENCKIVSIHDPESIIMKENLKKIVWEDLKKIKEALNGN